MEFQKVIAERYSVRKFSEEPLSQSEIDALLSAGHLAPTGCNNQPQRILVLGGTSMDKMRECTKCHFGAPNAMLVCYDKNEVWRRKYDGKSCGVADASIVATHIMLKAQDMGLGCTWVMHFDPQKVRESFAMPEHIEAVALLVLGHPAKDAAPLAMHSEYRPIEQTVVFDTF